MQQSLRVILFNIVFITLFSSSTHASVSKGDAAYAQGDKVTALAYYKAVEDTPEGAYAYAKFYVREDDLDEAEDVVNAAVKRFSENAALHYLKGMIMGQQASNAIFSALSYAGKSLDGFAKAVELAPENAEYRMGLIQFYVQAPSIAGGDMEQAWQHIQVLEALDEAMAFDAKLQYYHRNEDQEAISNLVAQAQKQALSPRVLLSTGVILLEQGQAQQALDVLARVVLETNDMDAPTDEATNTYFMAQYQLAKAAMLTPGNAQVGLAAINRFIANAPAMQQPQFAQWAAFRQASLMLDLEQDVAEATARLQALRNTDDKTLRKQVKAKLALL
jgi:hypothetical protein